MAEWVTSFVLNALSLTIRVMGLNPLVKSPILTFLWIVIKFPFISENSWISSFGIPTELANRPVAAPHFKKWIGHRK